MCARLLVVAALSLSALTTLQAQSPPSNWATHLAQIVPERYCQAPSYSEGPIWRDGELFFCANGLLRMSRERRLHRHVSLSPAGLCLKGDGCLLVADNRTPGLLEISPEGKIHLLAERDNDQKLTSLNDLTIDGSGNVYWTDPHHSTRENPTGRIYRLRPDGRLDRIADNLAFPNGLEVDPENRYLYVVESQTGKVLRYDLPRDDQPLGPATVFHALGGTGGDGCAFDSFGNLWVADFSRPETRQGRIAVLSPQGQALGYVQVPAMMVSNLTFGGKDADELFITTGNPAGVFQARVGVKGFRGHPGKPMRILRTLDITPMDEVVPDTK
ncbi:SMP-30/gluconolactonase/LRE family protein [Tuwongella immobilis]|uniref:SMP-30/Gluconolactonase/LRE-like region domain-containing protein n=1 Tax=Tuwongella immobilis TaxID=692036 RepID=A0A6C2YJF9_9BACT|nr:SMP-30/gluconolactonase/LRE family protein [Tuwongella immobilis]VIP01245.1 SMP-30/Gluconolaconase/LRE domain protein OS=uncultured prokaryote GN=HGMM_F14E02C25 PE=4 SV=1: SGL [Tuwongella immobilis]VTR97916.1 SMP-30/Gluconolaconase/LRE domain protein OS=uncultured prokaryote GN=HGMM_F14E02C25 PE=4 SV=1: SGL [Tuwongella immobilis]